MTGQASYQRVADGLKRMIRDRGLSPGDQIPPLPKIEETYGVSTNVARRAVAILREEGVVWSGAGQGTFVLNPEGGPPPSVTFEEVMSRLDCFEEEVRQEVRRHGEELAELKRTVAEIQGQSAPQPKRRGSSKPAK